jgi:hypothetical protein
VRGQSKPRDLYKHFRVRVISWDRPRMQRIQVTDARPPRQWRYLTIQDAEYLIGQLQRAIKRATGEMRGRQGGAWTRRQGARVGDDYINPGDPPLCGKCRYG